MLIILYNFCICFYALNAVKTVVSREKANEKFNWTELLQKNSKLVHIVLEMDLIVVTNNKMKLNVGVQNSKNNKNI